MATKIIPIILSLFLSVFCVAQKTNQEKYTLSGYVKEQSSKETLLGVSIYINELNIGVNTNTYGFYSLEVPKGEHEITFSYVGFTTTKKLVNVTSDTTLNIDLKPSKESLNEVELVVQKVEKQSQTNQMSAVSISQKDIEQTPVLLGEKDAFKTLQLLPGIRGGTEGTSGLFVRGGTPDQNLIILDESTVYNSNHLFGFFSAFNGDAIKSLTAYKGGFPARFGGRLSSVIKIDTKDGNKERLSGQFNIGLISSSLLLEGPIKKGKTSFIFSGRRTYLDLLMKPLQADQNTQTGYFFHDINFKIHHIFNDKNKLFWSSYLGQDKFSLKSDDDFSSSLDKTSLSWGSITSTLRWNHEFNNKLFSNTSLIYSNYGLNIKLDVTDFDNEKISYKNNTGINDYSVKTDFDYYLNAKHHLRFGAMGTYHNFVPQRAKGNLFEGEKIDVKEIINSVEGGIYVEDEWEVSDKVSVLPGLRYSYFKQNKTTYDGLEPRLSLVYRPEEDLAIKSSYAKMNQYVHLLPSTGIALPSDLWVTSTETVKPQISEQLALGVVKDFGNSGYSVNLEGYYKKMRQVIAFKEGTSFLGESAAEGKDVKWQDNITAGEGQAYGAEFLFRKQKGKLTGWLSYTLSWSTRQFDDLNNGKRFFARNDRRHDISIVGNYKFNPRVTLSATWVYMSGSRFTLPQYFVGAAQTNFPIAITEDVDSSDPFQNFSTTERNNAQTEASHRLDVGVQFHKELRNNKKRTWAFSLYNAYGRKNPFAYIGGRNGDFGLPYFKRISIFSFVPSVSYTLKF